MKYSKSGLLKIAKKVAKDSKLSPHEISQLLLFERKDDDSRTISYIKKGAVPVALVFGFLIAVFPQNFELFASNLPAWTNLSTPFQNGLNYIWNIIGEPVERTNILFHLPNIILYSFGFLGIKKLFDAIDRRTWVDKVNGAKETLTQKINDGSLNLNLSKGHSILFVGNGDFIASQFVFDSKESHVAILSSVKPSLSPIWNYFNPDSSYEDLENVLKRVCDKDTGEYIFFPVKDDQIFLPNENAYDLSPHKLDILCQDIRSIEKKNKWKNKRIIIVGDKYHKSYVHSEDEKKKIKNTEDLISLETISKKYPNITIVDPTEIVLNKVKEIASGRTIAFRATKEGISEYKKRFYERFHKLNSKNQKKKTGILTIGYDLLEDQTEQQTLSGKIDDYYPVVLSKNVRDALIRNGYKNDEFIYVPDLVLQYLKSEASKQ